MIMLMGVTKAIFSSIPDVAISIITCVITIVIKTYHNCPYCPHQSQQCGRSSSVIIIINVTATIVIGMDGKHNINKRYNAIFLLVLQIILQLLVYILLQVTNIMFIRLLVLSMTSMRKKTTIMMLKILKIMKAILTVKEDRETNCNQDHYNNFLLSL